MFYITRGEFQNHLTKYLETQNREIDFLSLFRYLKNNGLLYDKCPPERVYDYFEDMTDIDYLDYLNSAPLVFWDDFGENESDMITEEAIIPKEKDIFVLQHLNDLKDSIHKHDYFEINYVFNGQCRFYFEDEIKELKEGALCIISPFSKHEIKVDKNSAVVTICIRKSTFFTTFFSLLSQNDLLSLFFRTILYDSSKPNYLMFFTENTEPIKKIMRNLSLENTRYDTYSNNSCISWINLMFTIVLRNYNHSMQFYNYEVSSDFTLVLKYIQHNHHNITLSELAKMFHYTVPYISKLIKKNTGHNFCDLIKQLKMSDAVDYLIKTELKISEIAEICGYNSVDHFSRVFRSEYQVSPQRYRKENKI